MELARSYAIADYPCPAGGCLLTDKNFGERLRDAFDHTPGPLDAREIELLKIGRHFRLRSGAKAVLGHDATENERITVVAPAHYARLAPIDFPGPAAVVGGGGPADLATAAAAVLAFSPKAPAGAAVGVTVDGQVAPVAPDPAFDFAVYKKTAVGAR